MNAKVFFVYILFLFFPVRISSQALDSLILNQEKSFKHSHFYKKRISGGMEQNSITYINQDSIGNMWFATKNGLVKYNGKTDIHYKNNPKKKHTIGGNFVERVFIDNKGIVWVGTEPAVLSKYNPKTNDFTSIKGITGDRIKDIIQDKKGLLWISSNRNLYSYNKETQKLKKYNYKNIGIDRLLLTKDGTIYITTNQLYILTFNTKTKEFTEIPLIDKKHFIKSGSTQIYSAYNLIQDHKGYIWISTSYGYLLRYNPINKKFKKFIFETHWKIADRLTVMFLFEDKQHTIWLGTWFEGLYKILPNRKMVIKIYPDKKNSNTLSNNIVHSGFQDKAGYLWFGHEFSGIDILKKQDKFTIIAGEKNKLPNVEYLAITTDKNDNIWLGTAGNGLYYANKKNKKIHFKKSTSIIENIEHNWVISLLFDSKELLWIGTNNGLYKHNTKTKKTIHYKYNKDNYNSIISNTILSLTEGKNHTIWIGTTKGLSKLIPEKEQFYRFSHETDNPKSLSNNSIRNLLVDSNNTLWIGTFDGLNKFNEQTGNFTRFKQSDKNSIGANRINSLFEKNNALWIGSYEGGLTKYDFKTKQFKTYLKKDGLPDNNVKSILDDNQGNLWIATTNTIAKFNLITQQFTNYNRTDGLKNKLYIDNIGLQELEFSSAVKHKDHEGNIYFGGISGLTSFNPSNLPINTYQPTTIITDFKVNGKQLPVKLVNHLKPNENHLEIDLAVLNYIQPQKNKIAYFLKGIDSTWNYKNSKHHIEYFNLPKGHFTFKYKGANNDGIWSNQIKSIDIQIAPHFYESSLFYSLIILFFVVLFLAFILHKLYLKKQYIKQKEALKYSHSSLKKEEAQSINKRLLQLLAKEKPYLEADLSLQKLAIMINSKSHYLSQVINQNHQCSFHEFINKYRIEEAKRLLTETVLKIEAVAYDSGFNSISTFNASFKKETNSTPSKYRKSHQN